MWPEFPGCSCIVILMIWMMMMMTSRSFLFMMSTSSSLMTVMSSGWLLLLLIDGEKHWWVGRCWALWCRCLSGCSRLSLAGQCWSFWWRVWLTLHVLMMSMKGWGRWMMTSWSRCVFSFLSLMMRMHGPDDSPFSKMSLEAASPIWCRWPHRCLRCCDAIRKGNSSSLS